MPPEGSQTDQPATRFSADDVASLLRERGWLGEAPLGTEAELRRWLERAALLLGPQVDDREALGRLLALIFHYDAQQTLQAIESHDVLARAGARAVIRELAREVLAGPEIDSDRLKQIATTIKEHTGYGGRALFHPLRLALAGRAGEGDLDRVVLLVDGAAKLPCAIRVKGLRERMLEFCAALD